MGDKEERGNCPEARGTTLSFLLMPRHAATSASSTSKNRSFSGAQLPKIVFEMGQKKAAVFWDSSKLGEVTRRLCLIFII